MPRKQLSLIRLAAVVFALVVMLLIPVSAGTAPRLNAQFAPAIAGAFDIPPEIAGHEDEWPLANHDYANTRAAVGSSINAANVANLKVDWTAQLEGTAEWGGGTGNPVISDGVVYFQDLEANTALLQPIFTSKSVSL